MFSAVCVCLLKCVLCQLFACFYSLQLNASKSEYVKSTLLLYTSTCKEQRTCRNYYSFEDKTQNCHILDGRIILIGNAESSQRTPTLILGYIIINLLLFMHSNIAHKCCVVFQFFIAIFINVNTGTCVMHVFMPHLILRFPLDSLFSPIQMPVDAHNQKNVFACKTARWHFLYASGNSNCYCCPIQRFQFSK